MIVNLSAKHKKSKKARIEELEKKVAHLEFQVHNLTKSLITFK